MNVFEIIKCGVNVLSLFDRLATSQPRRTLKRTHVGVSHAANLTTFFEEHEIRNNPL